MSPENKGPEIVERLSEQQRKVWGYIQQGLDNKEIAKELGISVRTVKHHLGEIKKTTGFSSTEIAARAKPDPNSKDEFTKELTPKELEVARLFTKGQTNKEISAQTDNGLGTTKIHLGNIKSKLNEKPKNRTSFILAIRNALHKSEDND